MVKQKKKIFLTMMLLGISLIMMVGCGGNNNTAKADQDKEKTVIPVEACAIKTGTISAYFKGTATLEAENEAQVVAKTSGVVENILVEEGDRVKAGQILAKLDDDKVSLDLEEAQVRLKQLENDYKRSQELFQKNIISEEAFDRSKSDYEMQKTKTDLARLLKEYTSICAPISGVISRRLIKTGNMLTQNQPCFQISDFDPLIAILHVPEKELIKLKPSQDAKLSVDALPEQIFSGNILRISPVVDPETGTFKVTVAVKDPYEKLKPGMFARVDIVYDEHHHTLLAPKEAILTEGDETVVFLVTNEEKKVEDKNTSDKLSPQTTNTKPDPTVDNNKKIKTARRTSIEVGYINTTHIEILNGLKDGDIIVQTGIGALKDGSTIEILPGKESISLDSSGQTQLAKQTEVKKQ